VGYSRFIALTYILNEDASYMMGHERERIVGILEGDGYKTWEELAKMTDEEVEQLWLYES
jgi:hypothetical protein